MRQAPRRCGRRCHWWTVPESKWFRLSQDGRRRYRISGRWPVGGVPLDLWLFSEPVEVGSVVAGPDGSFQADVVLPDSVPAGSHTFVVSGAGDNTIRRAVRIPVQVPAATPAVADPSDTSASPAVGGRHATGGVAPAARVTTSPAAEANRGSQASGTRSGANGLRSAVTGVGTGQLVTVALLLLAAGWLLVLVPSKRRRGAR